MATQALAVSVPTAGTYAVDPAKSTIRFDTRHMFGLGKVSGTFAFRSGDLVVADPPTESSARAEVDAGSFSTGSGPRDKKVRSKAFLHVASFPVITFRSEHVRLDANTWVLLGALTVRGVNAPIELRVNSAEMVNGNLTLTASGSVDRYAHGIKAMKGMAARQLQIEATIVATWVN
jgi:polyisoprenoid-binding protein YceI